ncbi:hypothetical protein J32TS6_33930 [Virgibacillus pantothenticus]|uniref:YhfM-like domain-containing protein n=2 Tax=Virgibacillus pantothenticus TaxID=1473 RepID=A0A0L0QVE0_VIRPA|nr:MULTISPECIES: hypothetical protein [Virgibacillus]API91311.1 hypothetical protein BKP57_05315 [Virgibacillus sp. 6R]KNE22502.1 hypothetical protein AFK71_02480 [Virgibacillus pantothenticus]MBS7426544.1 hypothetical protein [Virgibacillus sp. 19R1-5]MED3738066.1 hypothetical protein [Virgibacillus pantothenticus]QTY16969.1 hypothetical protein KBP50_03345 [Virgibacillus pantothenticus]
MKKYLLLSILFLAFLLNGCSDEKIPLSEQVEQIKEIKISNTKEDYSKSFSDSEEIKIFKSAIKQAKKQATNTEEYDYDMAIVFNDKSDDFYERLLQITRNDENEIVLNYLGYEEDTYVIDKTNSSKIIDLIYGHNKQ